MSTRQHRPIELQDSDDNASSKLDPKTSKQLLGRYNTRSKSTTNSKPKTTSRIDSERSRQFTNSQREFKRISNTRDHLPPKKTVKLPQQKTPPRIKKKPPPIPPMEKDDKDKSPKQGKTADPSKKNEKDDVPADSSNPNDNTTGDMSKRDNDKDKDKESADQKQDNQQLHG